MRGEILWAPAPDAWTATQLGRFGTARGYRTYADLHRWSVTDLDGFWTAAADATGVRWRTRPDAALPAGDEHRMPGARWFPGGTLNYAEHAVVPVHAGETLGDEVVRIEVAANAQAALARLRIEHDNAIGAVRRSRASDAEALSCEPRLGGELRPFQRAGVSTRSSRAGCSSPTSRGWARRSRRWPRWRRTTPSRRSSSARPR